MSGRPWEKYQPQQSAPAQPVATPKPWERYAATTPQAEPAPEAERDPLWAQAGGKVIEGLAGLPGVPLDAIVGGGNFVRRQFDLPETQLKDTPLKDWGSEGWWNAARRNIPGLDKVNVAEPTNNTERVAQKAGLFFGGALPFGPAGMVPTATAVGGSEAGRAADQIAPELTKGYGETVGAVAGGAAGAFRRQPVRTPAPTTDQLRATAQAAYDAADNAGVIYTPQGAQRLQSTINSDLAHVGYLPRLHPRIAAVLDEIGQRSQSNVTLKDIDLLRRVAGNAGKSLDPSERMLATRIIEHIDDFVNSPQAHEVLTGNAADGAIALQDARRVYHQASKAQTIEDALANAETQAGSTYSGGNIDNATRQKLRPMITRGNKASRGWTADEQRLLARVVRGGGPGQRIARLLGKMSPEGNGLMLNLHTLMAGGGAISGLGPAGLVPGAAGFAAKRIADAMTRSNVRELLDTVHRGGQAYQPRTPSRMLTRASAPLPGAIQQNR